MAIKKAITPSNVVAAQELARGVEDAAKTLGQAFLRGMEILESGLRQISYNLSADRCAQQLSNMNQQVLLEIRRLGYRLEARDVAPGSSCSLHLLNHGPNKIQVIKCIRELTFLGLKEAMDICNMAPVVVKEGMSWDDAQSWRARLEEVGATAEVRGEPAPKQALATVESAQASLPGFDATVILGEENLLRRP